MKVSYFARHLLTGSALALIAAASPAFAQDTAAPPASPAVAPAAAPEADTAAPDIVVTGSRIVSPSLTSSSPVSVVSAQEIKLQGASRIEDVLNSLPQSFAAQSSSVSNGSNGTATANLRNLGDNRTLVLINGRRLQPGNPSSSNVTSSAPNLDTIPANLIKRVEVLTGGASSVYGSDAVAGVVNFVMDTDYKGFSIDVSRGLYSHNNDSTRFRAINAAGGYFAPQGSTYTGGQFEATLKAGLATSDNRGHLVLYGGYREIDAVTQDSFDYSNCGLAGGVSDYVCSGSQTAAPANFYLGNGNAYAIGAGGSVRPIAANGSGANLYNANPLNYFQRPDTRYTAGLMAHYDVSDAIRPYVEFNYMHDRTSAQIAPGGLFAGAGGSPLSINCDNPLLSGAERGVICAAGNTFVDANGMTRGNVAFGRRNVEGGGRLTTFTHTSYRAVLGMKGDVAKGISYDVYGQYGRTELGLSVKNEFSLARATNATDVVTDSRAGSSTFGQPICRSVLTGTDPACVPLNFFTTDPITPQALAYVQGQGFQSGLATETVASGSVTVKGAEYGLQTPWARDGIGLNFGVEYRRETVRLTPDQAFASGDLTGQGGPTAAISGRYNVKEAFIETVVPLISDRPFFKELTLNGGYRYSKYSTAGSVSSYKGELVWAPVHDIRFRGGYNRAVRAPNTADLFATQSVQLDGSSDPCAGTPTASAAACARTGVTAAQYGHILANPSAQYNGLLGGNVGLKPEKADTFTAGVILQPSFLRGFTATIDAFSVKIKDVIGQVGADTIINQCIKSGDPQLCGLIHRNAAGSLYLDGNGYIDDRNINAGTLKTRGIDVSVSYTQRTRSLGTFSLSGQGTYLDEYRIKKAGADFDCAGLFGAGCQTFSTPASTPLPRWRHTARLTWETPLEHVSLSGRWRYFSKVDLDKSSSQSDLSGSYFSRDARIKAQSYFDLAATVRIQDRLGLRIGMNNVFDKRPPIVSQSASPISGFGNGDTYPGLYDSMGRYMFVGASVDF